MRRTLVAMAALGGAVAAAPAPAQGPDPAEFCRVLLLVASEAGDRFRPLRSEQFDNALESFHATVRLPGFEDCRIDAIRPGYFCMSRGLSAADTAATAARMKAAVAACYPDIVPTEAKDTESIVARKLTAWTTADHDVRVVQRDYVKGNGSVYVYLRPREASR